MSPVRTVEVAWYYREPRGRLRQDETAERKTDVVLLEKYADEHNVSPDVFGEVRRFPAVKYFGESLKGNNVFADSITNVCNCDSTEASTPSSTAGSS
ncbi:hypothetical protein [Streptomyces sp. NRRL S-646]|uniref:hypothetical protein n=1 Tax=Streptomyces sp. NRRL S-646 TaxID=1463917 RepID=UPI000A3E62DC|nr:hypothetical protein [Streptomyces sp. NRRL S-646]